MCGICGWIQWTGIGQSDKNYSLEIIEKMTYSLKHRGPDGHGIWVSDDGENGTCILGHRKLAKGGRQGPSQPMALVNKKRKEKYAITWDGSLYNAPEVREILIEKGYVFQTSSDEEIVLCAYMEWAHECLEQFNGDFAFGVWNGSELFFARDRLGIKPFYYSTGGNYFLFASEMKALLQNPLVSSDVTVQNLGLVLTTFLRDRPEDFVPFKDIQKLKAGYCGTVSSLNGLKIWKYWDFVPVPQTIKEDMENEAAQKIHDLLENSVKLQMETISEPSEVVGCQLSGGIDSSSITHFLFQQMESLAPGSGSKLQTFSLGLPNYKTEFKPTQLRTTCDDDYIQTMVDTYKLNHQNVPICGETIIPLIEACTLSKELPIFGDLDLTLYLLCAEAKKNGLSILLSGTGSDLLFGTIPQYDLWDKSGKYDKPNPFDYFLKEELKNLINPTELRETAFHKCLENCPQLPPGQNQTNQEKQFNDKFYLVFKMFTSSNLERHDRLSMANSIEIHFPFFDYQLAQYGFQICQDLKQNKYIFRKTMEIETRNGNPVKFPESIRTRQASSHPTMLDSKTKELCKKLLQNLIDGDDDSEENLKEPIFRYFDKSKMVIGLNSNYQELREGILNLKGSPYNNLWNFEILFPIYIYSCNYWLKHYNVNVVY